MWKQDNDSYSSIYNVECQGELKCTVCVKCQKCEPYVHLYFHAYDISEYELCFLCIPSSGIRVIWDLWERWAFQDLMD